MADMGVIARLRKLVFRGPYPNATDIKEAEARWINNNREAMESGCQCGKRATHVRRLGGNMGSVPVEIWTCEEHVNVNGWVKIAADEHYIPCLYFDDVTLSWQVSPPRRERGDDMIDRC